MNALSPLPPQTVAVRLKRGEISLVDGRPRTATATAAGPVNALVIRRPEFLELMDRFGAVRLGVLMALTERVRSDENAPFD